MALGKLVVALGLDAAEFTSGLTKAERTAKRFGANMSNDVAKGVIKGLVGFKALEQAATFMVRLGNESLNTAASFQNLAEMTGASAEGLASFQTAAAGSATAMETIAKASVKLTKGLAGADEETKGAAEAIQKLGFNLKEFKALKPEDQMEQLALRLDRFADGSNKTAVALALMGRAGAEMLPFLKNLAAEGGRNVILTGEQAKAADDFKDRQAKLTSELKQYLQVLSIQAIPALTGLLETFNKVARAVIGVDEATGKLKADNKVRDFAEAAAIVIVALGETISNLIKLIRAIGASFEAVGADIKFLVLGAIELPKALIAKDTAELRRLLAERNKTVEEANKKYEELAANKSAVTDALRKSFDDQRFAEQQLANDASGELRRLNDKANLYRNLKPQAPETGGRTQSGPDRAQQERKQVLDAQLKLLDNYRRSEENILSAREAALSRAYDSDQLSINQYFEGRRAAMEAAASASMAFYDAEIKALNAFIKASQGAKNAGARADAQEKITDLENKRIEEQLKLYNSRLAIQNEQDKAAQRYKDSVIEIQAKVDELAQTEEGAARAAAARFDLANREIRARALANNDLVTVKNVDDLKARAVAESRINALRSDAEKILANLGAAEQKLGLERELGMRGELEGLRMLGDLRSASVPQLQDIADRWRDIATATNDKALIAGVEEFQQKINELAASADVLGDKFRSTLKEGFEDAFSSLIDGTTNAKNAFKSFIDDMFRQWSRMLASELGNWLFGKGSMGGGGAMGGGGGGGFMGAIISGIGALFGGQSQVGVFASGTASVPRDGFAYVHRGERIVPAHENRGGGAMGVNQTVNFYLPTAITRSTQNQIASRTLLSAQRAFHRGIAS